MKSAVVVPVQKGIQKLDEEDDSASSLQENLDEELDEDLDEETEADALLSEIAESVRMETIDPDDDNADTIILTKI